MNVLKVNEGLPSSEDENRHNGDKDDGNVQNAVPTLPRCQSPFIEE